MDCLLRFIDKDALSGDKKIQELLLPKRGSFSASGLDLVSSNRSPILIKKSNFVLISTGISIFLPDGFEGQIRPRSGLALSNGLTVLNSPGTIDSDYRGEIKVILINHGSIDYSVFRGMRIAQLIIAPIIKVNFKLKLKLESSIRSDDGFGSTGYF